MIIEIPYSPRVSPEDHFALHLQHRQEIHGILKITEEAACAELMAVVTQDMIVPAGSDHLPRPFGGFLAADGTS